MTTNFINEDIYLPKDSRDASIEIVIFRSAKFLGQELGSYYNEKMINVHGPQWLRDLSILRRDYNINIYDPVWAFKEPLNSDSPLRKFLPKSSTFYNKLDTLKKLRNGAVHNVIKGDLAQTIESTQIFFDVAFEIGLSRCANQFAELIKRLRDIEMGNVFTDSNAEKLAVAEREKLALEDKLIEMNEKIAQSVSAMNNLEQALSEKEAEYQRMIGSIGNTSEELAKANLLLEQKDNLLRDLKLKKIQESTNVREIIEEKKQLQEVVTLLAEIVMDDARIEDFRTKFEEQYPEESSVTQSFEQIGGVWHENKGKRKIVLSVKSRDLLDSRTNEPLKEIADQVRKRLAERWLNIRPSGGRVFIDDMGNATTLIDDDLIYLGRIEELGTTAS